MQYSGNRLIPLEGFRGIAAFIVLMEHFFLAFSPYTTGKIDILRNTESIIGQWFYVFFNGTAAVIFFFSLSGFVLCWSYFNHENPKKLLHASIKRVPRLSAIVTITTIISFILFKYDLYYFHEASKLNLSPWLNTFAFKILTPEFEPNFLKALIEGLTTFFTGQKNYNPVLWTMKPEFFGSMVVFTLAYFISRVLGYRYLLFTFAILSILAICFSKYMFPFVIGTFLSAYLAKKQAPDHIYKCVNSNCYWLIYARLSDSRESICLGINYSSIIKNLFSNFIPHVWFDLYNLCNNDEP